MQVVGAGAGTPEGAVIHAPLAVLPTPFPRDAFRRAYDAAAAFNMLTDRVAGDGAYLQSTLAAAAQHDDFTVWVPRLPTWTATIALLLLVVRGKV